MSSKDTKQIQEFLSNKKILIVSDILTDRTAWKKFFHEQMGVKMANLIDATTLSEAEDALDKDMINIVFTTHMIGDENLMSLVDKHMQMYPERNEYFSFMVTEKNSLAIAAFAAEHQVDALIVKPYNQAELVNYITKAISDALNRSKDLKIYYQAWGQLNKGNLEKAKEKIDEYCNLVSEHANAFFLKGLLLHKEGKVESAISLWEEGIELNSIHHQTLCHLFDSLVEKKSYIDAFSIAATLSSTYPINPERIPNFIRVALANKAYQNLIEFCDVILSLDDDLSEVSKPIAAGLAVCGKNLANDTSQQVLVKSSSLRAIKLIDRNSSIFTTCLLNLFEIQEYDDIARELSNIPTDEMTQDHLDLELMLLNQMEGADAVFVKAQNLIKKSQHSPVVYKLLVEASVKVGKSADQIEDIIFEAVKAYPNAENELRSIANT